MHAVVVVIVALAAAAAAVLVVVELVAAPWGHRGNDANSGSSSKMTAKTTAK